MRAWPWLLALALAACTGPVDDSAATDTAATDTDTADTATDTGATDTADTDTADDDTADDDTDPADDDTDIGPLDGYGTLEGDCGDIDAPDLDALAPQFLVTTLTLDGKPDAEELTAGGAEVLADGNAGGSSVWSEVFSFEVLTRCDRAELLKTETEIVYDTAGKITDLLIDIDDRKVGVSVTRAVRFPFDDPYTPEAATELLSDKLADIPLSSANVSEQDRWVKQILHIIAYAPGHAEVLEDVWGGLDADLRGDTLVLVTVTEGDDGFVYGN